MSADKLPSHARAAKVREFLDQTRRVPAAHQAAGRVIFAMDATASRQPTWDFACRVQGEMFLETVGMGGLAVQLVWYRGFDEFVAGHWLTRSEELLRSMGSVFCMGGLTQIGRVLAHAAAEAGRHRVDALILVGDCVEEDPQALYRKAGELRILGVPVFTFHEGGEPGAAEAFRQIAAITGGAYSPFDAGSARQLRELLSAVAVYAAGGRQALDDLGRERGGLTLRLSHQLDEQ